MLGLVREIVMVTYLGLGAEMGAFTVANKVPSLVRTLLADTALTAAFIPVFTGLLEKDRRREAWQVAYTVTVAATAILSVVTALGMVFAPEVVKVVAPGFSNDPAIVDLTVYLMRMMFPTVIVMGLAGIFIGILNSYDHFTLPALAPIVWNLVIIAAVVTFWASYGANRSRPGLPGGVPDRTCHGGPRGVEAALQGRGPVHLAVGPAKSRGAAGWAFSSGR